ncbi:ABC transporter permease [Aeromicrobium sp. P5_D10]
MTDATIFVRDGDAANGRLRTRRPRDLLTVAFGCVLLLLALAAILAPWVAPYPPNQTSILEVNSGPTAAHWLGTDALGRDIVSRLLFGARISLFAPAIIVFCSTVLGVCLAVSAVWFRGWYQLLVSRLLDLLFAVPPLLVAILAVAFVGPGIVAPVVALSLAFAPYAAKVVQSVVARERELPYIEACQLVGFGGLRICTRHLIPNVMPLIRSQAIVSFGQAVVALASVSFLGLGVQPPSSEWGLMVADGKTSLLSGYPMESLSAGLAIVGVVILTIFLGSRFEGRDNRL